MDALASGSKQFSFGTASVFNHVLICKSLPRAAYNAAEAAVYLV